jgi:hypothetical protein
MINIEITTTFDFGKLEKKLPDILKHYSNLGAKTLAEDARRMIKEGKLRNVTEGTMEIARKGYSKKRSGARKGTKQQALLHSGNALASIKSIDGEVHAAGYLRHHLSDYIIVRNSWTRKFTPYIIGKPVPARNPFFTPKGKLRKNVNERMKAHSKSIHRLIARHLKK